MGLTEQPKNKTATVLPTGQPLWLGPPFLHAFASNQIIPFFILSLSSALATDVLLLGRNWRYSPQDPICSTSHVIFRDCVALWVGRAAECALAWVRKPQQ